MIRLSATLGLLVAAVAVGCGGGDGDEEAIRDVVRLVLTKDEPKAECQERLRRSLVRRVYGSRERCVRIGRDEADESKPPDAVGFERVEVDGDEASVEIVERGGDSDGAQGAIELVRDDGDWRINDFSASLLRSQLARTLRAGTGAEELGPDGADCLLRATRELADPELRQFAYAIYGETEAGLRRYNEILAGCEGEGGRSALRQQLEERTLAYLRGERATAQERECVLGRLREVPADRLVELFATGEEAFKRRFGNAVSGCRRRHGRAPTVSGRGYSFDAPKGFVRLEDDDVEEADDKFASPKLDIDTITTNTTKGAASVRADRPRLGESWRVASPDRSGGGLASPPRLERGPVLRPMLLNRRFSFGLAALSAKPPKALAQLPLLAVL